MKIPKIKNKNEARKFAISWQNWASKGSFSYVHVFYWNCFLKDLEKSLE